LAENSTIEWTDHTFNPWIGCTKVSPACKNCYAERDFDHRFGKAKWGPNGTRVITSDANWKAPLVWDRAAKADGVRRKVFCASLADVYEDWQGPILSSGGTIMGKDYRASVGNRLTMQDVRRRLFDLIDVTPNLDYLLLTKRPENILSMWDDMPRGFPHKRRDNVWLGTSVENQEWAEKRIPELLRCRELSPVLFLSCEPLVGPLDLTRITAGFNVSLDALRGEVASNLSGYLVDDNHPAIDWVITGGESGLKARPCDPEWFRSLRDQCDAAGVPFHFKQWGEFDEKLVFVGKKNAGRLLDGRTHDGVPG